MKKVTLAAVAREAGCSLTTASLVLNDKKNDISDATKERIFDAAKRLNYRPNRIAAGLTSKKTYLIGLILPDSSNPFFSYVSRCIEQAASDHGYQTIYANSDNNLDKDIQALMTFDDYCVDGVLLVHSYCDLQGEDQLRRFLSNYHTPTVMLDRPLDGVSNAIFMTDNQEGGYIATRHLLDSGHRRIAFYSNSRYTEIVHERLRGYQRALAEYGIEMNQNIILSHQHSDEQITQFVNQLMGLHVTGVFAYCDKMAYALYRHAGLSGMHIPNDLSIVGYDDIEYDSYLLPALTSVRQPVERMCRDAVEHLIGIVASDEEYNGNQGRYLYVPSLTYRESVVRI